MEHSGTFRQYVFMVVVITKKCWGNTENSVWFKGEEVS